MAIYVVTKTPIDLDGATEIVGAFTSRVRAGDACVGAGKYRIARVVPDRAYKSGTLLDVESIVIADHRELKA